MERENEILVTDNPQCGGILWELHYIKHSTQGNVLVFTEQMQQKMHFMSTKNIKLYYLELALTYFCIVNAVKIVWVVNCLAPILILKLNICAYKQTKIFWQPKLMQLRRVYSLYFLNLACLPVTDCLDRKVSCLEIQHERPSGKVYLPFVGQRKGSVLKFHFCGFSVSQGVIY